MRLTSAYLAKAANDTVGYQTVLIVCQPKQYVCSRYGVVCQGINTIMSLRPSYWCLRRQPRRQIVTSYLRSNQLSNLLAHIVDATSNTLLSIDLIADQTAQRRAEICSVSKKRQELSTKVEKESQEVVEENQVGRYVRSRYG